MIQKFTCFLGLIGLLTLAPTTKGQSVITQWNFNAGSLTPSTGAGTLSTIGGITSSYGSGSASGGSSDPATTGNQALQTTAYPAATAGNKSAGVQFRVSTAGYQNIQVTYDLRHSNTSSRYEQFQYTTDVEAASPVWTDFTVSDGNAGDTWFNLRTFNLTSITALNNNPKAAFRVVSVFDSSLTPLAYAASGSSSNYAGSGTWRFDMLTVKGTTAALTPANVSFAGTKTTVTESAGTVNITATLTNGNSNPSSVDLELIPLSTATSGADFTLPASLRLSWPAGANNASASIAVAINNDALPESAEYFMVRLTNPVNMTLPTNNHYTVMITDDDRQAPIASQHISLNHIASFSNGAAGTNSAEIVAHDPLTQRLFIANSIGGKIDIVNFSNPAAATLITSVSTAPYGNINSLAVRNGIVAVAIENAAPQQPGSVVFFNTNGIYISQVTVGAMPDMVIFSPDGTRVFTANEGEPNTAYTTDPEGSVSIIDISGGVAGITQAAVATASFAGFNAQAASLKAAGVRLFGYNNPTVAQDMEPEYISFSGDGATAYVACQENNAIAIVNIATASITEIRPLGTKNHAAGFNGLDVSDQGSTVEIANWPVKGLYMPDAIASYTIGGQTYLVTANEGDAREYTPFAEAVRAGSATYVLDSATFPYAAALKANISRLYVTTASGDLDGDGDFDEIHAFGGRSISIWNAGTGALVWDGADDMELITSRHPVFGAIFNASNANNTLKNRSDDKGPEPEGVTVAEIAGRVFAFVTLERIGGCLVYDITDPANPVFVDYKNNRNVAAYGGDNGPEGIIFIAASNSPTGSPMVVLANEVSSTLSFYGINTTILDISLDKIRAYNIGSRNRVEWNTVAEQPGDVFELERRKNGSAFTLLTTITAKGTAAAYSYTDEQPYEGTTYYRLKMKHTSGRISYTPIVKATVGKEAAVALFPNPVKDKLTVTGSGFSDGSAADIIDLRGAVLQTIRLNGTQTTIDLHRLPAGAYFFRYQHNGQTETLRFVKE